MLVKFDVTTRRGSVLTLEMEESENPIQVVDIEGLNPVNATLVSTSYAGLDGDQFQSARRGPRNIKIKLELDPDFETDTYTSLRQRLYSYFMPKSEIKLRFYMSSGLYVDITGHVESHDGPLFDQDPGVEISIMCFQPDFIDPRMITLSGVSVEDTTNTSIDYPGNVEAGTVLTLTINRALSDFSLYNLSEGDRLDQLDFAGELLAGDLLVISSLRGAKGITLTRAGASRSYLYGRTAQSGWIEFYEGINEFRMHAEGDPIPYQLEYMVRYGGL